MGTHSKPAHHISTSGSMHGWMTEHIFQTRFLQGGGAIFYRFVLRDTLYHQLLMKYIWKMTNLYRFDDKNPHFAVVYIM